MTKKEYDAVIDFLAKLEKEGYDNGKEYMRRNMEKDVKEAHTRGWNDRCHDTEKKVEEAYEKGLNDAWEIARKLSLVVEDGGFDSSYIYSLFNRVEYQIFRDVPVEEVMEKIKEYEEKQNRVECAYLDSCAYPDLDCPECEVACSIERARKKIREAEA